MCKIINRYKHTKDDALVFARATLLVQIKENRKVVKKGINGLAHAGRN
jgi:hypothetical protein